MRFAPEAWNLVVPILFLGVIFSASGYYFRSGIVIGIGIIVLILGLGVLLFFRDPPRQVPSLENCVVAPADGKVIVVATDAEGRKQISIFLSVFDVHINRVPIAATIKTVERKRGNYHHAGTDDAYQNNACVETHAESAFGPVVWRQVVGCIARRIACSLKPGDHAVTGQKFGLMYFGSRMDVFLPAAAQVKVHLGDRTVAGKTVIATF